VATLPPGDDPDTVARRDGRAGVERVLHDAVDLLERKIQIIERKGLLATLPGRRRALDRLVPTIRAAQDPITRELYLDRAAQVTGVRKDVLEREVGGAGAAERDAPGRVATRGGGAAPGSSRPGLDVPAGAERTLLLLMLSGDVWKSRVREAVGPDEFLFPAYRTVYQALVEDAPERLDETGARTFEELKAEELGGRDPDGLFAAAMDRIEARRLSRQIDRIERELPLVPEADRMPMLLEKTRLVAARNAKAPTYKMLQIHKKEE
jgi:DNA primase